MFIEKGFYIQSVSAANLAGFDRDDGAQFYLAFQLFDENGRPATGSYKGVGTIVTENGKKYVVLGDPSRQANLPSYLLAEAPTPESENRLEEYLAGYKAAVGKKRKKKTASATWLDGYADGSK